MPDMTSDADRPSPARRDRPAPPRLTGWRSASAGVNLVVSLVSGGIVGALAAPFLGGLTAGLLAWLVTAGVFLASTWASTWNLDAEESAWLSARGTNHAC